MSFNLLHPHKKSDIYSKTKTENQSYMHQEICHDIKDEIIKHTNYHCVCAVSYTHLPILISLSY